MITSADQRLGRNNADEIKSHPFFSGVDWNTIRNIEPPFVPHLKSSVDTQYFPVEDLENVPIEQTVEKDPTAGSQRECVLRVMCGKRERRLMVIRSLAFLGYTFRRYEGPTNF